MMFCNTKIQLTTLTIISLTVIANSTGLSSCDRKYFTLSKLGVYDHAAVTTNSLECAKIGTDILKRDGSVTDAAIATLLCEGVVSFQSSGLGGGFMMTVYNASSKKVYFLNAREMAPGAASKTMFLLHPENKKKGGQAVAVPGELMGMWKAYKKGGRLAWKDLFQPAIDLCEKGTTVSKHLYDELKRVEQDIKVEPSLRAILIDPTTNELYKVGQKIVRTQLAATLKLLANASEPVKEFYEGKVADDLVQDIQSAGGIITKDDFISYRSEWSEPLNVKVGNLTFLSAPLPGSGPVLVFIMQVLKDLVVNVQDESTLWQRIVETFKWAFGQRTKMGDPRFIPNIEQFVGDLMSEQLAAEVRGLIKDNETFNDLQHYDAMGQVSVDHGAGHINIFGPDGSAVSVTTSINRLLGAKLRSNGTGIILNNQMGAFNNPISENSTSHNFIEPHKQPLSSLAPTIILDQSGRVKLIIGGAGGNKIPTSLATVLIFYLYKNYNIKEAIDTRRLHHQLSPTEVFFEHSFCPKIINNLKNIGHIRNEDTSILPSAVSAISLENGKIKTNADFRWNSVEDGY